MNQRMYLPRFAVFAALTLACGSTVTPTIADSADAGTSSTSSSSSSGTTTASNACALTDNTTATSKVSALGCAVLTRNTSSCDAARQAAGITGFWLRFSCRVTLTKSGGVVTATSDDRPDYKSNYFPTTDACHETFTATIQNPNFIVAKTLAMSFPTAPTAGVQRMTGAFVGMALNGVGIFGNFAAPGDDIYQEADSFDRCTAHPQMAGNYHYHSEPASITNDDANLVGVMRDGYPIYGRRDMSNALPSDLDAQGGHTAATADSATPTYHYHVNEQTSTGARTAGQKQWFLTTGNYHGAPGACSTCN